MPHGSYRWGMPGPDSMSGERTTTNIGRIRQLDAERLCGPT